MLNNLLEKIDGECVDGWSAAAAARLTQSEAAPAEQAEEQQPPHLLDALLHRGKAAALRQLLPQRQSAGPLHPAGEEHHCTSLGGEEQVPQPDQELLEGRQAGRQAAFF